MSETKRDQETTAAVAEADQFSALLQKQFKPKTDRARAEVENAVRTLAEQALRESTVVSDDVIGTIKAIIAEIDEKLTAQLNLILHNERFQQLESAWRGLHYLVNNTETDEMLKIRVMNISKKDLARTLKKYHGAAWHAPLARRRKEQCGRRVRFGVSPQRRKVRYLLLGQRSLCHGGERDPLVPAVRVVVADSRRRVGRHGGRASRSHLSKR